MNFNENNFKKKLSIIKFHFNKIYLLNNKKHHPGCGSYLFNGAKYEYQKSMYGKQKLLYNLSKDSTHILEIGVYMGHSMLIMLLANPRMNITCIDIDPTYAVPSVNYLKRKFPKAKINLVINDSVKALKKINKKFDIIHIDGDHTMEKIYKEILFSLDKSNKHNEVRLLFDDIESMMPIKRLLLKSFYTQFFEPKSDYPNFYIIIKKNKKLWRKQLRLFKNEFKEIKKRKFSIGNFTYYLIFSLYKIIFKSNPVGLFLIKKYKKKFKLIKNIILPNYLK